MVLCGCSALRFGPFARAEGPAGDPAFGVQVADSPSVIEFNQRASSFYGRLAHRRFNVIGTFRDEYLREFFRTDHAFSDYYADFAQDLDDAHFDRNRPDRLEVVEFSFLGPGEASVRVQIVGEDGRPLRPGRVRYLREDRWERVGGTWWIVPGKL
jgi:hypothetical protein